MKDNVLSGKYLPVHVVRGYIYAYFDVVGHSMANALYQMAKPFVTENYQVESEFFEPMEDYFQARFSELQPLNYILVSSLVDGISSCYPNVPTAVQTITRQVGRTWWGDDKPVAGITGNETLQNLVSSFVLNDIGKIWSSSRSVDRSSRFELAYNILGLISAKMQEQTTIQQTIKAVNSSILIQIVDCPFCMSNPNKCRVHWGIVWGYSDWLHLLLSDNIIQIDLQHSKSHDILVAIT